MKLSWAEWCWRPTRRRSTLQSLVSQQNITWIRSICLIETECVVVLSLSIRYTTIYRTTEAGECITQDGQQLSSVRIELPCDPKQTQEMTVSRVRKKNEAVERSGSKSILLYKPHTYTILASLFHRLNVLIISRNLSYSFGVVCIHCENAAKNACGMGRSSLVVQKLTTATNHRSNQ